MDIAGLPVKKHAFTATNTHEPVSPMARKPFSSISFTESSAQKTITSNDNTPLTTPSKVDFSAIEEEEENRTPNRMMIPPSTPSTAAIPMQTAMTPAPPVPAYCTNNPIKESPEEMTEYSFEERRAGFVLPRTHLKTVIQV